MPRDKKPTPLRKDKPSAMLFGRIKNVEVAGKGGDAVLIVTITAPLTQDTLRQKMTLDKMWARVIEDAAGVMVQIDETPQ